MNTLLLFTNLLATLVFLCGGLYAGFTFLGFLLDLVDRTTPGYALRQALEGRVTYPWVRRSVLPGIAALWLLAAFATGNLLP